MGSVDVAVVRLAPLRLEDEVDARAIAEELAAEGFQFLLGIDGASSWSDYLALLADNSCGRRLPHGHVPSTFLGTFVEGELVGRTSIRHSLTPSLEREGGHIGFAVREAHRRRGIATEILRQSLVIARAAGVQQVLVTCDDDNIGSATVIERCGGVLEDLARPDTGGTPTRRYWIH